MDLNGVLLRAQREKIKASNTKLILITQAAILAGLLCYGHRALSQQSQPDKSATAPVSQTTHPKAATANSPAEPVEKNGIYEVGGPVLPPKLIQSSEPAYTRQAAEFHISGNSAISLIVDAEGKPRDVIAVKKIGLGLDENAVKAVQEYRFQPAMLHGKPVPVRIQVVVAFHYCEDAMDCAQQMATELAKEQADASRSQSKPDTSKPVEKDGIYEPGGSVLAPKLIKQHSPKYTREAKRARTQSICGLSVVLDAQGQPQNIQVVQAIGMGLDESAVAAVKQWRFQPATLNGKPVPVRVKIMVQFSIFN